MNQPWYIRLGWWLCEKFGHPLPRKGWIYEGQYHRDCRLCGRIVSEPLHEKSETQRQHVTDGLPCWCEPETRYTDPEAGASVIVHREPQ
jgi:hypothetical protein